MKINLALSMLIDSIIEVGRSFVKSKFLFISYVYTDKIRMNFILGKCELYHWIDILDLCDEILESATLREPGSWVLSCDQPSPEAKKTKELVLWTLNFTTLLIEHSFSRHLYSSMEHLSLLLSSFDLDVVLAVLNLLYMFSKR